MYLYSHSLELGWTSHQALDGKITGKFWKRLQDHFVLTATVGSNLTWDPTTKTMHVNDIKPPVWCIQPSYEYGPAVLPGTCKVWDRESSWKMSALCYQRRWIKITSFLIFSWEHLYSAPPFKSWHVLPSTWNTTTCTSPDLCCCWWCCWEKTPL